jgi:hypothetical protein
MTTSTIMLRAGGQIAVAEAFNEARRRYEGRITVLEAGAARAALVLTGLEALALSQALARIALHAARDSIEMND